MLIHVLEPVIVIPKELRDAGFLIVEQIISQPNKKPY